jgi:hypothetical protein
VTLKRTWTLAAAVVLCGAALGTMVVPDAARGGDLRVEAAVDSRNVAVGDNLTLTITVYGDGKISQPNVSAVEGFQVVGSYSSQSISIVNAKMSKSVSIQYSLLAVQEGDFTLGPFTVKSGNDTYQTEPIAVRVTKGGGSLGQPGASPGPPSGSSSRGQPDRQAAGDLIMAFATADRKKAYVGEQITYTLTFAYRTEVEDVSYLEPGHTGFWFEDIGETGPEIRVIDGTKYYAITKITAFFPISSGQFTIGEGGVRYLARDRQALSRDPSSFFGRDPFDAFRRREGISKADPIRIEVVPLPNEGKPSDFSGAVGNFGLKVQPSANEVRVGESVTLSVKVQGQGNVKSIGDFPLPKIEGFRVFAPKSRDSLRVDGTRVGGAKIFDLVLVPERVGRYVLDGFNLSYFDPAKGSYVRTTAQPVEIEVLEGDEATMRALAASGGEGRVTKQDIRYIKKDARMRDELKLAPGGAGGVAFRLLPIGLAGAGIVVVFRRRHGERSGRTSIRKTSRALARDLKAAEAAVERDSAASASAMASKAIRNYVALRKGMKESAVDAAAVGAISELKEARRCEITSLVAELDRVRFAPLGSSVDEMRSLLAQARALMAKVDQEWSD